MAALQARRAETALRTVLRSRLGCRNEEPAFGASSHGKPFALVHGKPAPGSFNVSHGGGHGLIAFAAEGRLGVNVEELAARRGIDGLIAMVLGPNEQAELLAAHGRRKLDLFFRLWTVKEALIKARGLGLSLDMSRFEVPAAMRRGVRAVLFRFPETPAARRRLDDLSNEHFAAAGADELRDFVDG